MGYLLSVMCVQWTRYITWPHLPLLLTICTTLSKPSRLIPLALLTCWVRVKHQLFCSVKCFIVYHCYRLCCMYMKASLSGCVHACSWPPLLRYMEVGTSVHFAVSVCDRCMKKPQSEVGACVYYGANVMVVYTLYIYLDMSCWYSGTQT